ncbi:class I SAM-dependent methyltransferase [Pacificimonas sp. WHA3]|uniref:Class I SAM-dependent methyltransferase n=1 Tax=Pacificimonas pallii TaxID=2827236 RepID=A0ABS6SGU8_9SPHN|nr:class I SAM-dependent methyltransferase [Pacificimonas pallii]MBV7257571.1 class I SAM-dependent methyltransferase [Pacificimonas pallii]
MSNRYFLPSDYQGNEARLTFDTQEATYWDEKRLGISLRYQHQVYALASKLIFENGFQTVFDVGCGPASKLAWLHDRHPEVEFTGFDQPNAIAFCKDRYAWGNWVGDDFDSPAEAHPEQKADLVISSDVIEHLTDPDRLLDYVKRRLKPNGVALFSTPDRARLYNEDSKRPRNPYHIREWTAEEFKSYLSDSGFKIVRSEHQLPVRVAWTRTFRDQVLRRALKGQSLFYNFACVTQLADEEK